MTAAAQRGAATRRNGASHTKYCGAIPAAQTKNSTHTHASDTKSPRASAFLRHHATAQVAAMMSHLQTPITASCAAVSCSKPTFWNASAPVCFRHQLTPQMPQ